MQTPNDASTGRSRYLDGMWCLSISTRRTVDDLSLLDDLVLPGKMCCDLLAHVAGGWKPRDLHDLANVLFAEWDL